MERLTGARRGAGGERSTPKGGFRPDFEGLRAVAFGVVLLPPINARAAEEVAGASLIDPTPMVCPEKTCPAVIGDALVYRNGAHLTRTYVRTLTPWLGERLPEPTG